MRIKAGHNLYYVYIATHGDQTKLMVETTGDLIEKMEELNHNILSSGAEDKNQSVNLLYWESFHSVEDAFKREKQIRKLPLKQKKLLIQTANLQWQPLNHQIRRDALPFSD